MTNLSVDCQWNDWDEGDCSKPCGGGLRNNTRTEKVAAENGGAACVGENVEEVECNTQECEGKLLILAFLTQVRTFLNFGCNLS